MKFIQKNRLDFENVLFLRLRFTNFKSAFSKHDDVYVLAEQELDWLVWGQKIA